MFSNQIVLSKPKEPCCLARDAGHDVTNVERKFSVIAAHIFFAI